MPRRSRFENQISRASAHAAAGNGVGGPFPIIKWLDEMHAAGSAGPTLQGVDSGDEIVVTKHARVRRGKVVARRFDLPAPNASRSEEHTSELQSLMRISYAVFCLKHKNTNSHNTRTML